MNDARPFVDYYNILQVTPSCDARILENAYRHLAKMYHPDHMETADLEKFTDVIEAYGVLRHPDQRAEYDLLYADHMKKEEFQPPPDIEPDIDDIYAINDANAHAMILRLLYKRRRTHALEPGVGQFLVQELLNCSDAQFEFHIWYLRAKGFIETTEQGTLAITIEGVDHVISTSRTRAKEKLLIAQSDDPPDRARP